MLHEQCGENSDDYRHCVKNRTFCPKNVWCGPIYIKLGNADYVQRQKAHSGFLGVWDTIVALMGVVVSWTQTQA